VEETSGGESEKTEETKPRGRSGNSGGRGGRAGSIYALFAQRDGKPGEEVVHPDPHPRTQWISAADGTREASLLEDRAAKYYADQNLLLINADFRVFTDMIERWAKHYGGVPGARDVVVEAVHEWFEQALVETILGAQGLQGSAYWTAEDLNQVWSEEGLTSAVLQRYHVDVNVKRTLGAKLGSLKDKAVA
jgi:hypothetical protein